MRLGRPILVFAILVLLTLAGNAWAVNRCQDVLFDIPEFQIQEAVLDPQLSVTYRAVPYNSRMYKAENILGNTQDVLIGFSEYGHAYVVADKLRLDGDIIGRPTQVRTTDVLDTGVVIRIQSQALDRMRLKKFNDTNGLTCSRTACKALGKAAGLYVGGKTSGYFSPHTMLRSILKDGIRDADGNQIPFDVYYVGNRSFKESVSFLEQSDARITKEIGVKGAVITTGAAVTTMTLLYAMGIL